MIAVISLVIILLAVPVTLFETQQVQDPRQEAATGEITSVGSSLDEPCPVPDNNPPADQNTPPQNTNPNPDNNNDDYTPPNNNNDQDNNDYVYTPPNDDDPEPDRDRDSSRDRDSEDLFTRIWNDVMDRVGRNRRQSSTNPNVRKRNNTNTRRNVQSPPQDLGEQIRRNVQSKVPSSRNSTDDDEDLGDRIRRDVQSKVPSSDVSDSDTDSDESSIGSNAQRTVDERLREAGIQSTGGVLSEPCEPTPEPDYVYRDGVYYPYPIDPNIPEEDYFIRDGIAYPPDIPQSPKNIKNDEVYQKTDDSIKKEPDPKDSDNPPPQQPNRGQPVSVSILNYNSIIDCYSDTASPRSCDAAKKAQADLNGDGRVNQIDYNIFIVRLRQSTQ